MAQSAATLAQAAARIGELEELLVEARAAMSQAETDKQAAVDQLQAAAAKASDDGPLKARIAELELLLAPPPALSGIALVQRYRTPHGTEHALLGDAMHAMKIHSLTSGVGMTLPQAEAAVQRAEAIVKILSASG